MASITRTRLPASNPTTARRRPVVLHEAGLINANAVESISSAMEISAIDARNAAALIVFRRRARGVTSFFHAYKI